MIESELISECRQGNNVARKKLYEIYSKQMMGICYRYTGDKEIAQDLLHDGFIKVFTSIHTFQYRGEGSFKAWISKIFTNTALEYLRKSEPERMSAPLEEWQEADMMQEEESYDIIPNQVLMDFISELPMGYRTIFNLYTFEEMSHKEIGKILNINEGSSRSQLSRAKSILIKKINEYVKSNE